MSSNNRMHAAITGIATTAIIGSGIAFAPNASAATSIKAQAYSNAVYHIGDPYRYGYAGPNKFDCSGLVYWNYTRGKTKTDWEKKHPGRSFPRTAAAQYNYSKKISKASRTKGDLVFFYSGSNIYHVGYYAGNGKVLHAPRTGQNVKYEKIWTSSVKYGRINS